MGEYIPIISPEGQLKGFISVGSDFFTLLLPDGTQKTFFWLEPNVAYSVTQFLDDNYWIHFDSDSLYLLNYLDLTPSLFGYVAYDIDEYVNIIKSRVKDRIKGCKVLFSYSGGKDSNASLVILSKLQELISFKLYVAYVHVPILDSEKNIDIAEKLVRKLGLDLIVLEADKKLIKKRISDEGLPHRGHRWCTYQKIKPIRKFKREYNIDYEVINDRAFETFKRLISLVQYANQRIFISGRKFRPIFPLTFLDIVKINRDFGLVHPSYTFGNTRVSCTLCPYRSFVEVNHNEVKSLSEYNFICQVLEYEYQKWYSDLLSYKDFAKFAMWRYGRYQSEQIVRFRKFLHKRKDNLEKITYNEVVEYLRSPWVYPLPQAPSFDIDFVFQKIRESLENDYLTVINLNLVSRSFRT